MGESVTGVQISQGIKHQAIHNPINQCINTLTNRCARENVKMFSFPQSRAVVLLRFSTRFGLPEVHQSSGDAGANKTIGVASFDLMYLLCVAVLPSFCLFVLFCVFFSSFEFFDFFFPFYFDVLFSIVSSFFGLSRIFWCCGHDWSRLSRFIAIETIKSVMVDWVHGLVD